MAIYEVSSDKFRKIDETTFSSVGLRERQDLQRLLRSQIEIVSPDTLIVSEEFSQWEDSNRRIDLLGVDKNANLVVIELKRTEDGGLMELQSIRYAAMVSAMTFERVVEVFARHLQGMKIDIDPRARLLEFLEWEEPDEDRFAQDVRVVLVSAEFSRELTTTVIWLNDRGLDIECIRIKPYRDGERILVDVQPIIPLPEAEDYRVRLREKQQRERESRKTSHDLTKFDVTTEEEVYHRLSKRRAIQVVVNFLAKRGRSPEKISNAVSWRKNSMFVNAEGEISAADFVSKLTENAANGGRAFDVSRYYCTDEDLIHFHGKTFALSSQWGTRTEEALDLLIAAFPEDRISYKIADQRI